VANNFDKFAKEVLPCNLNRVERFYIGGAGLDKWQNTPSRSDGSMCEDMLLSTCPYVGPGHPDNQGLSTTQLDGRTVSIRSLIESNEEAFLGKAYVGKTQRNSGVMCRAGDTVQRLVLQYHPTGEFARKYFSHPYGKTESWYIAAVRGECAHYCYAGFKPGMTRERFKELFMRNDVAAILDSLHVIPFEMGDMLLIKSGTIHAMGANTTFLEIHEPCDYTMRLEWDYMGRKLTGEQLHYGLGVERLLDGLDFTCYTHEQMLERVVCKPVLLEKTDTCVRTCLIDYAKNPEFRVEKMVLHGAYAVPDFDGHYILIAAKGGTVVHTNGKTKLLPQGRAAFVPAFAKGIVVEGQGTELIAAYPFLI